MNANNRRDWIKKSALIVGAMALTPYDIWAKKSLEAQQNNEPFLYPEHFAFNEFTPPKTFNFATVKARLGWNENPYGPSKKATEAFIKAVPEGNLYCWMQLQDLIKKVADFEGVKPTQVLMGPGSTDLLERVGVYFFKNEGNIVSADPSYMSLVDTAKAAGATWKSVGLTETYEHDLAAMQKAIDADTKLVYITNPNNPTGTTTNRQKLYDYCEKISEKVPVFIDEAYLELSDGGLKNSMVPLVKEGKNVMVARTFSKVHGMAGLRIGYMVANEEIIEALSKFTIPGFGITGPSIAAASASLDDKENIKECTEKLVETRNKCMSFLKKKKINYLPSQANFVIFEIPVDGQEFQKKIGDKGIFIRTFKFWDKNWCRVSMGKPEEMDLFYSALTELMN